MWRFLEGFQTFTLDPSRIETLVFVWFKSYGFWACFFLYKFLNCFMFPGIFGGLYKFPYLFTTHLGEKAKRFEEFPPDKIWAFQTHVPSQLTQHLIAKPRSTRGWKSGSHKKKGTTLQRAKCLNYCILVRPRPKEKLLKCWGGWFWSRNLWWVNLRKTFVF